MDCWLIGQVSKERLLGFLVIGLPGKPRRIFEYPLTPHPCGSYLLYTS
jgi:hypothetical protein